jgi:hypothetical protein
MDYLTELRIKNIERMLQEQEVKAEEQEKKEVMHSTDKPAEPTEEQLKALREKLLSADNKTATKLFNENPELARKALQSK